MQWAISRYSFIFSMGNNKISKVQRIYTYVQGKYDLPSLGVKFPNILNRRQQITELEKLYVLTRARLANCLQTLHKALSKLQSKYSKITTARL